MDLKTEIGEQPLLRALLGYKKGGKIMAINFNKFAQEGQAFVNDLAERLGHPGEVAQTGILLRAVLHTLRDSMHIGESLNLLSQLPMFIKALYVENWKYSEKPLRLKSIQEFTDKVEEEQANYGENRYNWNQSTFELTKTVLAALGQYVSPGEMQDIMDQMPKEVKELFSDLVEK